MGIYQYYEYHSFPDDGKAFTGNPAGVCLLEEMLSDAEMLGIANSNNHAETAFVVKKAENLWYLRWFTPALEVDLCGHATLAAAAALFESGEAKGTISFDTLSGRLEVNRDNDVFNMTFPKIAYKKGNLDNVILDALGSPDVLYIYDVSQIHGYAYQMVILPSERAVACLVPDFGRLKEAGINVIVTAMGESTDFVSRFFAPASGVDEDPVTGSAHCTLGPFWAERLEKTRLTARQIGPRSGSLEVEIMGDCVRLIGKARLYLKGHIETSA